MYGTPTRRRGNTASSHDGRSLALLFAATAVAGVTLFALQDQRKPLAPSLRDFDPVPTPDINHYRKRFASSRSFFKFEDHLFVTPSIMTSYLSKPVPEEGCLDLGKRSITPNKDHASDPTVKSIYHQSPEKCGKLSRPWNDFQLRSDYALKIAAHQSRCGLPIAKHTVENSDGLGSHLNVWAQAMCNAMEMGHRLQTVQPVNETWIWLDTEYCDYKRQSRLTSPLLCYFPHSEYLCPGIDEDHLEGEVPVNVTDPRDAKKRCSLAKDPEERAKFSAAAMEFLFRNLGSVLIKEAERQAGVLFPGGIIPDDLVAVHIRWGDSETKFPKIEEYVAAVTKLLADKSKSAKANIYLSTEDQKAAEAFKAAAPSGWNVYTDVTVQELTRARPNRGHSATWTAINTRGRAGLIALGSLLVTLEAQSFVLTTKSNWSAIINSLRKNVIDPGCGDCTKMIDLLPGDW